MSVDMVNRDKWDAKTHCQRLGSRHANKQRSNKTWLRRYCNRGKISKLAISVFQCSFNDWQNAPHVSSRGNLWYNSAEVLVQFVLRSHNIGQDGSILCDDCRRSFVA